MSAATPKEVRLNKLQVNDALPAREHTPTNAELFFYNAALWNAHRIHYDLPYAKNEEGYEGLVIAGPQMGDWMTQVIDNLIANATDGDHFVLSNLSYSNRQAAYIGETVTAGGVVTEVALDGENNATQIEVELFVKNAQEEVITPGTATVKRLTA